ncbi:MAG: hypothetical protein ABIO63_05230 [Casimicrobiaceae bacterium]
MTRKTSWMPLALGVLSGVVLLMSLRSVSSNRIPRHLAAGTRALSTRTRWASVLTFATAIVRIAMLPQVASLWRALRQRRR